MTQPEKLEKRKPKMVNQTDIRSMEMDRFVNTPLGFSILLSVGTQMSDEDWRLLKQCIENERLIHTEDPGKHEGDMLWTSINLTEK